MYIIYYYINVYPVETTKTTCFSFKLIYNYTVIKFWKQFPKSCTLVHSFGLLAMWPRAITASRQSSDLQYRFKPEVCKRFLCSSRLLISCFCSAFSAFLSSKFLVFI